MSRRAHPVAVASLVGVFAYQGLVPKLWRCDDAEVALWREMGLPEPTARRVVRVVGAGEMGFAAVTALRSGRRWPFVIAMAAMPALATASTRADRSSLGRAFNPGSLGIAVVGLAAVALITRTTDNAPAPQ